MHKYLVLIACLIALNLNGQSNELRVLVEIDHKVGYLNEDGEIAIPANFAAGGVFSGGLAPVRESGFYGYIDPSGSYVLPPAYEYAEPFHNGLARVWNGGVPRIIDRRGCHLFLESYVELSSFYDHTYATVKTKTGKYGLIGRTGCLMVDTILSFPPVFDQAGLAAVEAFDHANEVGGFRFGVIDTTGSFVYPFTPLKALQSIGNGYFTLSYPREWELDEDEQTGIIGPDGQLRTNYYWYKWHPVKGSVSVDGIIPAKVYDVNMVELRSWNSGDRLDHAALMSADGKIIAEDTSWEEISSITDGRAFVCDTYGRFWLIDDTGLSLSDTSFSAVCGFDEWGIEAENLFHNGEVIVRKGRFWYEMDWNLKQTRLPDFGAETKLKRSGNFILLEQKQERGGGDPYGKVHGWYDLATGALVSPRYEASIRKVERTNWLTTILDGRRVFLHRNGDLVWQEDEALTVNHRNIDFKERANFEAHQWLPKRAYRNDFLRFDKNTNYLAPWMDASWLGNELKIYTSTKNHQIDIDVVNLTADSLWFPAQDGTIELLVEARNERGKWEDIQYLGSSWCGNSYHTLVLPPNHAWNFSTPMYHGGFRTEVRLKLTYQETLDSKFRLTQYSDPIPASVNPAQFWRKPGYQPGGLMDPYLD